MISVEIDTLTNSIQDRMTGEIFETIVSELSADELKEIKNWQFNWLKESRYFPIFKLTTVAEPTVIQGLMSIKAQEGFIFMSLIETAPHNFGSQKQYLGVAGNLVAFACKNSFENGYGGYVSFISKSQLVEHYKKTLKAEVLYGPRMVIKTPAAIELVRQYFKNFYL
jgi:hypothetical protein